MTLLISTIIAISFAIWISWLCVPLRPRKKPQSRYQKYKIPSQFWEDYNKINFFIHDMGIDECERVKYLIDDFTYKYAQIMDYKVYVDCVGNLISKYYDKEKQLLQFKLN